MQTWQVFLIMDYLKLNQSSENSEDFVAELQNTELQETFFSFTQI